MMEIELLSAYKHENLVSLVGFCDQDGEKILVYKHESNGSLDKLLQSKDLNWIQRLRICLDAAKGLKYLHHDVGSQRKVVHRDVKSSNILLDENMKAKISDFGLSKISPTNISCTFLISTACGTIGYIDPEYFVYGVLTEKSDIYSFGVVLFEVLCGRLARVIEYEDRRQFLCILAQNHFDNNTLHEIIDPNLRDQMDPDSLKTFSTIAYDCLTKCRKDRPSMIQIVELLQKALDEQQAACTSSGDAALHQGHRTLQGNDMTQLGLIASSHSTIASSSQWNHDRVFLNFRGMDTRNTFVDHLYSALVQQGISTYLFDQTLPRGESIYPYLFKAIEESRISVIVFSENYADSFWCLDELAYIMKCKDERGQIVMPVYYHIDPSEVQKQKGRYGEAFAKHESENKNVEDWRKALKDVGNISGWETKYIANGYEAKLVKDIVDSISNELFPDKYQVEMETDHLKIPLQDILLASSFSQSRNHNVFVSFRVEDTRKTFVDHLYSALAQKQIYTYQDEEPLMGKAITPSLLKAIEESWIAVIVLSEHYVDSPKCLNELAYIMKCKNEKGKIIIPIFYHMDPSEVITRNRTYIQTLAEHESENKNVESWREALADVRNLSGFMANGVHEGKLVKEIVDSISSHLGGGFGKVYKGHSEEYGTIAVKRLDHRIGGQGQHQFMMEIELLSAYKHENLVSLVGFCDQDGEKILVYKYESNGSLDKHLESKDLSWIQRLRICLDAAKGLKYLHHDVGPQRSVVHRDVKSSNILLDENMKAKISDFGLSKVNPMNTFLISSACGTTGYIDPEYFTFGVLTEKSDVYSFGVVLFEVLCGRPARVVEYEDRRQFLCTWAQSHFEKQTLHEIIDPDLLDQMNPNSFKTFSTIAYHCLTKCRKDRPSMTQIVERLEKALDEQLTAASGLWYDTALHQELPTSQGNDLTQSGLIASSSSSSHSNPASSSSSSHSNPASSSSSSHSNPASSSWWSVAWTLSSKFFSWITHQALVAYFYTWRNPIVVR